jgi:hypothetical protein
MSELVIGRVMVRIDDGQKGVVAENGHTGGERRITYLDRGEVRVAQKSEKWAPEGTAPTELRPAERFLIAATCDRALRAYEKNEPHKYWETIPLTYKPYDVALMGLIDSYLSQRSNR